MTRLTSRGIYTVKIQNHPRTSMPPKSEIMKRGGYKCRTLEMHLQLRDQQLKTISYIYRLISKLHSNCKLKLFINPSISSQSVTGNKHNQSKEKQQVKGPLTSVHLSSFPAACLENKNMEVLGSSLLV